MTARLSARRQTATARAGHATGSCPPHPADDTNRDQQPGEHDAPSSPVLPGPGVVATHRPPVPANRRPAVHREPAPPRAPATPRPSRTRAVGRHAPRSCRAERHRTSGVTGPGTCPDSPGLRPMAAAAVPEPKRQAGVGCRPGEFLSGLSRRRTRVARSLPASAAVRALAYCEPTRMQKGCPAGSAKT